MVSLVCAPFILVSLVVAYRDNPSFKFKITEFITGGSSSRTLGGSGEDGSLGSSKKTQQLRSQPQQLPQRSGSSSDISVLSNPSQSSIEVLNTVMQQQQQQRPLEDEEEEEEPPEIRLYEDPEVKTSALTPAPSAAAMTTSTTSGGQAGSRKMVESSSSGKF